MESYIILKNGIKGECNKWREILYPWGRKLNIVKISVLLKLAYRVKEIPIKITASYFMDLNKLILQFI